MNILFDSHGTMETFTEKLNTLSSDDSVKSIVLMTCDNNGFTKADIDPVLLSLNKPVLGGIFPGIVYGNQSYEKGTVLVGLDQPLSVFSFEDLSNPKLSVESEIHVYIREHNDIDTTVVFLDGLASGIGDFIDELYDIVGNRSNFIGGGAGSLSFDRKPVIITNKGLLEDAAVVGFSNIETEIEVRHGWVELNSLYQVTESCGNTIISLDWKPAMDVYKDVIEAHSGKIIRKDNFFDVSKNYPFGISMLNSENIIRDPISVDEKGYITCVGNVPDNSFVHIMTGTPDTLIESTEDVVQVIKKKSGVSENNKAVFFIDCISRKLFMENEFFREIEATDVLGLPVVGALTLGEIANSGNNYLAFLNKSSVIAVLS